jgi:hypothetical protein
MRITILIIFFCYVNSLFSQKSPCPASTDKLNFKFQENLKRDSYQQILADYPSVDFNELTSESESEIRYTVFFSELALRKYDSFDFSNFTKLIKSINSLESIDCKVQYVTIISNLLVDGNELFPELAINLCERMLKSEVLLQNAELNKLKYYFLYNLYNLYARQNRYKEAEKVKIEIDQLILDPHQKLKTLLTESYENLELSNFSEAHSKLLEADQLFLFGDFDGKDSMEFTISWAKFYNKIGDKANSKLYFQIALEIANFNKLESDIALIQFEIDRFESDVLKRIEIFENRLTNYQEIKDPKLIIAIMDALAKAYSENHQFEYALKTWQTIYQLEKQYDNKVNQITLWNLALGYKINRKYQESYSVVNESFNNEIREVSDNFHYLSFYGRSNYWYSKNWMIDFIHQLSVLSYGKESNLISLSYNVNLLSKSLLLETSREVDNAISESSDENLKAQFAEMKQLRRIYSKMQSEGSENKEIMERYKTQADSLDKILVNKLGEYAASKRKFEITWKDVQSNLTTTDAAIEFARYYDDKDSLYKYMALVVRPDYEYPKLVSLGEEDAIRTAVQNKDFSTLYNEAWKGIDSLLVGVKRVYYSPAGELNNVSFSALCTEEGNEFIASNKEKKRGVVIGNDKTTTKACNAVLMDKYELHQLTTTRYLADGTLKKEKPMQPSLALVGGINFDEIPEQTKEADKEQSNEDFAFHVNLNKRSASNNVKKRGKRSSSNYGKRMESLPGTKEEVVNIAGLLNTTNWKVQTKSDKKAGEYEFKKELETKAPGVLHIATHGFAFPDEAKKESKLLDMNQTSTYKVSEDPMVRCGLMLGGSNISWSGNPQKMIEQTGDDGILTAAEVANLDLSNTKLVVLSACETGLGKIEGSEGTFGLKRGFKLAGVEQMIVSLWSVPDKETMELMTLFYSDLTKTLNPVTSFYNAQKEMRNKYPTDPEKWAGFVLVR